MHAIGLVNVLRLKCENYKICERGRGGREGEHAFIEQYVELFHAWHRFILYIVIEIRILGVLLTIYRCNLFIV